MLYTTLKLCKENNACESGYRMLSKSLPSGQDYDTLIPLTHVIESNGLVDAIWALRATTKPCRNFIAEFAVWCAEQVLDIYEKEYPDDKRVRECLEGIRKYQRGEISKEDLAILRRAAHASTTALAAAAHAAAAAAHAAAAAAHAAAAAAYTYTTAHAAHAAAAAADAFDAADAYAAYVRQSQKAKFIEILNEQKEK
jgi:hypothetical protein